MGSGSRLLAQITGPAKDNGKGARGSTLNFFRVKVFLIKAGALGTLRFRKPNRAPATFRRTVRFSGHES